MRRANQTSRSKANWALSIIAVSAGLFSATATTAATAEHSVAIQPSAAPATDLPEAAEVFEHYIEAIGGRDAIAKIKNRRITGTYTGDPFEFKANLQVWWEADGRYHQRVSEPAGLKYDLFVVGRVTWEVVMNREPEPMGGVQRQELLDTADFTGEANYKNRYKEIEVVRKAKAGDQEIYIVRAVTHAGRPHTLYFATDSGLLIGTRVPVSGQKNSIRDMTVQLLDYKDIGGVLYPTRFVQNFTNEENTKPNEFVFSKIEVNVTDGHEYPIPDKVREKFQSSDDASD